MPEDLRIKWDKIQQERKETLELISNFIVSFFKDNYDINLEKDQLGIAGTIDITPGFVYPNANIDIKDKIKKDFKMKPMEPQWYRYLIEPKSQGKLANKFKKEWEKFNTNILSREIYMNLLGGDLLSLSFKTTTIYGKTVFLKIEGVNKEELGLIEREI
jgi:hypothetical protein